MSTRRKFLTGSGGVVASVVAGASTKTPEQTPRLRETELLSLCGEWRFRIDPNNSGIANIWYKTVPGEDWRTVVVPHTWQIEPALTAYRGIAWYWRSFDAPLNWQENAIRVEFEAVFHTAAVWINGQ